MRIQPLYIHGWLSACLGGPKVYEQGDSKISELEPCQRQQACGAGYRVTRRACGVSCTNCSVKPQPEFLLLVLLS